VTDNAADDGLSAVAGGVPATASTGLAEAGLANAGLTGAGQAHAAGQAEAPAGADVPAPGAQASFAAVFAIVTAGIAVVNLDLFIVNVAIPSIGRSFGGADLAKVDRRGPGRPQDRPGAGGRRRLCRLRGRVPLLAVQPRAHARLRDPDAARHAPDGDRRGPDPAEPGQRRRLRRAAGTLRHRLRHRHHGASGRRRARRRVPGHRARPPERQRGARRLPARHRGARGDRVRGGLVALLLVPAGRAGAGNRQAVSADRQAARV
jgi:hypothetical protein